MVKWQKQHLHELCNTNTTVSESASSPTHIQLHVMFKQRFHYFETVPSPWQQRVCVCSPCTGGPLEDEITMQLISRFVLRLQNREEREQNVSGHMPAARENLHESQGAWPLNSGWVCVCEYISVSLRAVYLKTFKNRASLRLSSAILHNYEQ